MRHCLNFTKDSFFKLANKRDHFHTTATFLFLVVHNQSLPLYLTGKDIIARTVHWVAIVQFITHFGWASIMLLNYLLVGFTVLIDLPELTWQSSTTVLQMFERVDTTDTLWVEEQYFGQRYFFKWKPKSVFLILFHI